MTERNEASLNGSRRVATVDVGTNSIRLLIAEARPDGSYRLLDDEKVVARLGRGTSHSRVLNEEAMQEAARMIAHMKAIAEGYNVELLRAVATCAVREAENREAFLELVREETGLELDVISGEEEGRLAYLSVKAAFDIQSRSVAVVDIGGGSTEIVLSTGGMIEQIASLSLGAVRLTELLPEGGLSPDKRLKAMRRVIRDAMKEHLRKPSIPPQLMIGTGGTFTTLAQIDLRRPGGTSASPDPVSTRGHTIQRAELRRLLDNLNAMSRRRRLEVAGLSPDRVDIIVAGLCIAETVMKRLGVNTLSVHDRGIRDGLLLGMTHELFPEAAPAASEAPDRLGSARSFAEKCQYERLHSEHVTTMAMEIYDQLAAVLPSPPPALADPAQRELLQVASILHDVGYYINYSRHHKHSYHLIVHSDLPGFSHRELEIIANIARYHRRAHPKAKHEAFMQLEPPQRDAVQQLAAILRIADGLDRAHAGNVRHVTVEVDNATAYFTVDAEREPEVDLWGAARKSRLFYKVFGLEPRFLCSDHAGNATAHRVNDVDESVTVEGREG